MDPVIQKIRGFHWNYAEGDSKALAEIEERLVRTARQQRLIPYSELVAGVTFHLANVNRGTPFQLGAPDWLDLHSAILGEFLGRISCDTYGRGGFLLSAVAVSKTTGEPSEGFQALAKDLGLISSKKPNDMMAFWAAQVSLAYDWYKTHER